MRAIVTAVLVAAVGLVLPGPARGQDGGLRVSVDLRTELMSIVFRLAANPEYNQGRLPTYMADVDRHFGPYKDHAVVARARELRRSRGVSYDAPMGLAIHITQPPELRLRVPLNPWPTRLDKRWTADDVSAFLADLRDFVRDSQFMGFVRRHEPFYRRCAERMEKAAREARVVEWLGTFFGKRPGADYIVSIGLLNGGGNYGPSADVGGREEIYSIMGAWQTDANGDPVFGPGVSETLAHEMCHSYANPLVNANLNRLRAPGEAIFARLKSEMSAQAYGSWQTVMRESLVRACTVRYVNATSGAPQAMAEVTAQNMRHFLWIGGLSGLLAEYEKDRSTYPTLETFMPRIVSFFSDYVAGGRFSDDMARLEKQRKERREAIEAKSPRIVSMSPENGATGVPPATSKIVIVFDRPMLTGNMALMLLPGAEFPPAAPGSKPGYDAEGKVLTLTCQLQSGTTYGFSLNSENHLVMRDIAGNPLTPTEYRFTTAEP